MRSSKHKLTKKIFYVLCGVLPLNLGLHFIFSSAYVGGLLIDYLVPTVFVQDLVALALILYWLYENFPQVVATVKSRFAVLTLLLLYVLLLSTLLSPRFDVSIYAWLRWLLYSFVGLYVYANFDWQKDFKVVAKIFSVWLVFLGLLAIGQFIKQGALFNNYLILGEQPYSISTPLIDKENVLGHAKVPAYGLFRHPNIFGGITCLLLILILYAFRTKYIDNRYFYPAFIFGSCALILTFSYFSWLAFIIGVALLFSEVQPVLKSVALTFATVVVAASFFIHLMHFSEPLASDPSVYKRMELLQAGYEQSRAAGYLFGVGLNSSTVSIEQFTIPTKFIRFVQPPHNIFVLLLAEGGIIALSIFVYLLFLVLRNTYYKSYLLFVLMVQFSIMSCFDHYFLTIQQPFLLFWILVGLSFP